MRTLHVGIRVADADRAGGFNTAVGYEVVGRVPDSPAGQLTMLELPDDDVVSVELVFDARPGSRTPTATGSSWSSGRRAMPKASPPLTGRDSTSIAPLGGVTNGSRTWQ